MENEVRYYLYKIDGVPSISMRELEEDLVELEDDSEVSELVMSTEDIQEILAYFKDYYDYSDEEIDSIKEIYE